MKSHLKKATQSFIDNHLDTLNLMRKNIWWGQGRTTKIKHE